MTPTSAVRSILGDPSGTLSEARRREVVVAVLRACREPSGDVMARGWNYVSARLVEGEQHEMNRLFAGLIDALIEEVTAL